MCQWQVRLCSFLRAAVRAAVRMVVGFLCVTIGQGECGSGRSLREVD